MSDATGLSLGSNDAAQATAQALPSHHDPRPHRRLLSKQKPEGSTVVHVWMSREDRQATMQAILDIAKLTGQKPSTSVLLRAGVTAMAEAVERAKAERNRNPEVRGRTETEILFWIANAAKINFTRR